MKGFEKGVTLVGRFSRSDKKGLQKRVAKKLSSESQVKSRKSQRKKFKEERLDFAYSIFISPP